MTEEIEHRTVAFDIYEALYGDYFFRAKMCWIAQSHILTFIADCMKIMSPVDVARSDETYRTPGVASRNLDEDGAGYPEDHDTLVHALRLQGAGYD